MPSRRRNAFGRLADEGPKSPTKLCNNRHMPRHILHQSAPAAKDCYDSTIPAFYFLITMRDGNLSTESP